MTRERHELPLELYVCFEEYSIGLDDLLSLGRVTASAAETSYHCNDDDNYIFAVFTSALITYLLIKVN